MKEVVDEVKQTCPYFEFKIIDTGLKIVGKMHIEKILKNLTVGTNA